MRCWLGILIAFLLLGADQARAQHPICGKTPDWDIKSRDTDKLKGDLQGKAQLLTKYLGSAELSGQIQTERETIYKNTDESEARRQDAYLAYMFCVLIMDDKTLSTPDKIKSINEFKRPFNAPRPQKNGDAIPQGERATAAAGADAVPQSVDMLRYALEPLAIAMRA